MINVPKCGSAECASVFEALMEREEEWASRAVEAEAKIEALTAELRRLQIPNLPRIVGFGYKRRHGKDTAANALVEAFGYERVSFADAGKRAAMAAFDLTEDQVFGAGKTVVDHRWGRTPGRILQLFLDGARRTVAEDVWVRRLRIEIDKRTAAAADANQPAPRFVVADVRYESEARAIKSWGGVLFCVFRPGVDNPADGRDPDHVSEIDLDGFTGWDGRIVNDSSIDVFVSRVITAVTGVKG